MSSSTHKANLGRRLLPWLGVASVVLWGWPSSGSGQYIRLDTPFQSNTESFYERMGVDFGFSLNGSRTGRGVVGLNPDGSFTRDGSINFTQNGVGSAVPPFGGHDPNADAFFGFGRIGDGGNWRLGLFAGQGNTRTSTSTTPTIVVPNGVGGSINDTILRPFVTGFTPVVGGFPPPNFNMYFAPGPPVSPLELSLRQLQAEGKLTRGADGRLVLHGLDEEPETESGGGGFVSSNTSTATQGDLSVEEIVRQRESRQAAEQRERDDRLAELLAGADRCLERRQNGAARIYLRQAIGLAEGELREELVQRYESLK